MAVVQRVTTLRMDNSVTHADDTQLTWVATAATLDTAAGSSVVVTIVRTEGAGVTPDDPDTLTLRYVNDSGTVIKTVSLNTTAASQNDTFHLTDTGSSGGSARCGTVEMKLQATRGGVGSYDVETDGAPNTPPAGFDAHTDRGWIRGSTTLVEDVSNVGLGGGETEPAKYLESLFFRATSGAASYVARALTVASSAGSLSGSTNSTTSATRDITFSNVVDNRFAAGTTTVTWAVTVPNATLTGSPAWIYTTTTDDAIDVNPDITIGTITLGQSVYNRTETATLSFPVLDSRGGNVTASLSFDIKDGGGTIKKSFTDTGATYGDGGAADYAIANTDRAANDITGDQWTITGTTAAARFTNTPNVYRVSRKWLFDTSGAATLAPGSANGLVFTGKAHSPTSDTATSRNRGQTLFFRSFVYNVRGELLASPTVNFNIRPTGSETYEESNDTEPLVSGEFTGAGASYVVDLDEATGGKCLVLASQTCSGTNQARTGTAGTGNFGETSTSSAEWTVSSTYTVTTRTQKESSRNADTQDTQFTIGEDVIYTFAQVLDSVGDGVNGVTVDFEQRNPSNAQTQTQNDVVTGSDGWTPDPGAAFDSRAPAGTGWVQRATIETHNGNTGTDDQAISMLSAFTANKNITIFLGPFANQPNGLGYPTHTAPGNHPRPGDGIGITIALAVSGARVIVDATPVPKFSISVYTPPTQRQKFLQSDGTFKSRNEAGFAEQFFDFKSNLDDSYVWVVKVGTAAQSVTASDGHIFDTSTWPSGILAVNVVLYYNSQEFRDDDAFLFIPPSGQHPYNTRRELSIGRMEI